MASKPHFSKTLTVLSITSWDPFELPHSPLLASTAQVTAVAADRLRQGASGNCTKTNKNIARDSYRMMRRTGVSWKIPIETFDYKKLDGSFLETHYLAPRKILQYLIPKHPLVICGARDALEMEKYCGAFWQAYQKYHPDHKIYETHMGCLQRVIPLAIWGDEGKGKRRSSTTLVSLEAVIGCKGQTCSCKTCQPSSTDLSQFGPLGDDQHLIAKQLRTNMKSHSYLQHWPLFIVPGTLNKNYKPLTHKLTEIISDDLYELFTGGIEVGDQKWYGAVVAAKGDLKWHSKLAKLVRGHEHQGTTRDIPMCHHCKAGFAGIPAEDIAVHHPCWERTLWYERPWLLNDVPSLQSVPYDSKAPERMYVHDPFHTLRLGLYRDFVGSVIFLLMSWGMFGRGALPVKIDAAWNSFSLWQLGTGKKASLRSFSKALFNYTSKISYPWINAKGSDVTLCLKWLQTVLWGFSQTCDDDEQTFVLNTMLSTCKLAIAFFDIMNDHRLWMNTGCAANLYDVGHGFMVGYVWLAGFAYRKQLCLFSIKPKAHFFRHILLSLRHQLEANAQVVLNPLAFNTEQNEDMIGKIASLVIKLNSRYSTQRVLEFWMVKACVLYKRHFKSG